MKGERVVVVGRLGEVEDRPVEAVTRDGGGRGVDEPERHLLGARVRDLGAVRALPEPPGVAEMTAAGLRHLPPAGDDRRLELAVEGAGRAGGAGAGGRVGAHPGAGVSRRREHEVVGGAVAGEVLQLGAAQRHAQVETLVPARGGRGAQHRELGRGPLDVECRPGAVPAAGAKRSWSRGDQFAQGALGPEVQLRPSPRVEGDRHCAAAGQAREPGDELSCDAVDEARAKDDLELDAGGPGEHVQPPGLGPGAGLDGLHPGLVRGRAVPVLRLVPAPGAAGTGIGLDDPDDARLEGRPAAHIEREPLAGPGGPPVEVGVREAVAGVIRP